MPELPEVETVRLQLLNAVVGKKIDTIEVFHGKTVAHDETIEDRLRGKAIAHVDRIGKLLIFSFKKEGNLFLLAHLKMTGQFFYVSGDSEIVGGGHSMSLADITEFPGRHTRVAVHFSDRSSLFFNDMRLFGYLKLANRDAMEKAKANFGEEPISDTFDVEKFYAGLKRRKTAIKAVLLDQSFVAGLGNIYVDEALFRARVKPTRRADRVTKKEAVAIATASGAVMKESIKVGGTTFQHFKDTGGNTGNFTKHLQVFGKQGTPCPVCGTTIKKIRVAGRGTHFCPKCQK